MLAAVVRAIIALQRWPARWAARCGGDDSTTCVMNQPSLSTPRLELHPAGARDLDRLHALCSQPEVRRFLFDDQDVTLGLATSILDSCLACSASGYGLWLVHHKESRELLGCVPPLEESQRQPDARPGTTILLFHPCRLAKRLREELDKIGGFLIVAHPFRHVFDPVTDSSSTADALDYRLDRLGR